MSPRPHDGPADDGLSAAFLRLVQDRRKVEAIRAHLSGFCHRCRNSLNGIKLSLYLFRREARGGVPACWPELESTYQQVEDLFDALQSIYRPMAVAKMRLDVESLIAEHLPKWRSWFETRGLAIRLEGPDEPVPSDLDPVQLGAGLDAVARWRAEAGSPGTVARLGWSTCDGAIELSWEESACGPANTVDRDSKGPGEDRRPHGRPVDALALPILARVVAEHGGRLQIGLVRGLSLRARWPQFEPADACRQA
ncbi:MAG: ATP-binding protein [Isosphaeraceae bacterium]